MTCGSSGTGINDSIPEVGEQEGDGKESFPTLGNGKGIKNHFHNLGTGRERKKHNPKFQERKRNEQKHSQNSGTGRQ